MLTSNLLDAIRLEIKKIIFLVLSLEKILVLISDTYLDRLFHHYSLHCVIENVVTNYALIDANVALRDV